jgi:GTPase SAR1 family protein
MSIKKNFKMIVVGDSGVGKTCLVRKFSSGTYSDNYNMTVGVEFESKDFFINNEKIQL